MKGFNSFDYLNSPAMEALKRIQESSAITAVLKIQNSGALAAVTEMQKALKVSTVELSGLNAAVKETQRLLAPYREIAIKVNEIYAPIIVQKELFESINISGVFSAIQESTRAMKAISEFDLKGFSGLVEGLSTSNVLGEFNAAEFSIEDAKAALENGEITSEEIVEEIAEIAEKKQFSLLEKWDEAKKKRWYFAFCIFMCIVKFIFSPVDSYIEDKTLDALGITQFWEESGVYEFIDNLFELSDDSAVSEEEAKSTVDSSKTGNVSKQNRDELIGKIKELRAFISSAPQDENTGNLLSYLSDLEKDVNGKKYGLVFEEHREDIDEVLDTHTPVLTEDEDLFIDNGGQVNFLIEGDNLASLKLLEKTHKGKIDLIYIDPPYNTMSTGFTYSDALVDSGDNYRHSKWSSFMKHRLEIARALLSPTGCVFISIDDNEFAALKLVCDEVFGWQNFVTTCMWQKIHSIKNDAKYISVNHDFIFVYAKNIESLKFNLLDRTDEMNSRYKNPDNDPRGPWQSGDLVANEVRTNGNYDVIGPTGKIFNVPEGKHWVYSEENMKTLIDENRIWFGKDGTSFPRKKRYLTEVQQGRTPDSWWTSTEVGHNQEGARELKSVFDGKVVFTNPKPTRLIERIIKMGSNDNSTILDFFAGSGTTGHAILKYNADNQNSNRQFILCTNNENSICRDVTYERIKRVIDKEDYTASLKYFKVEYVPISERMYYEYADELLQHIRELVELENGINFNGNAEIAIVLTDEELEDFIANLDDFSKCKKIYMGHDLLPTEEQEQAISLHKIEVNIIPDYYYRDLQEH